VACAQPRLFFCGCIAMASVRSFVIAFGWLLINEASGAQVGRHAPASASQVSSLRVFSKKEIMAQISEETALQTVLGMSSTRSKPELTAYMRAAFSRHDGKRGSLLQTALRGTSKNATGYSALASATEMLNKMTFETQVALEAEEVRCETYNETTLGELTQMRTAVRTFNAKAAEARGQVVRAQSEIAVLSTNLVTTKENFETHKKECEDDLNTLNGELTVVLADIVVMGNILELTDCNQALLLVQCRHCNDAIMIQHSPIQKMLGRLESPVARQYIQDTVAETYAEAHGKAFLQMGSLPVGGLPVGGVNVSDVPQPVQPFDCQPNNKCSLSTSPNCQKLKDKFLNVQGGIVDKRDELEGMIRAKQQFCNKQNLAFTAQIDGLNERLGEERTNLAVGTENQNQAETGSHQKSQQHEETSAEYMNSMQECCTTQNNAKSEICALEKIRGELLKMEGQNIFIVDCDTSDWSEGQCSKTCGLGEMLKTRTVITQPENGGVECPALEETVSCNPQVCPVDCAVKDWSGWSSCSAECGGGVLQRSRPMRVEPEHDGEPCPPLDEEVGCNIQSCDGNCILSDWLEWSSCSKYCGTGSQGRTRNILEPARGGGECSDAASDERQEFKDCNTYACEMAFPGQEVLQCDSNVDIVIVMDGSASLRRYGWEQSTHLAEKLVSNLNGSAQVAFLLFSGPLTWKSYKRCTGRGDRAPDLKEDCGMEWISHFTNDTATLANAVSHANLEFPRKTTLTSFALGLAESELVKGRPSANSVVIVITDGKPLSQRNTRAAAKKLQEKAKLIWVPVGSGAPRELIESLASKPQGDHVISVDQFKKLDQPQTLNKIITTACPVVTR